MKKSTYENFVGVYDDYFSPDYCNALIEYHTWCSKNNKSYGRSETNIVKDDESINLNPMDIEEINFTFPNIQGFIGEFNSKFWDECYKDYRAKYSTLDQYDQHTIYTYKIQKTLPGGGYHIWHCEDGSKQMMSRLGVYILYLNDVEEGGETEFLYYSKRIAPKQGRLLIFPPNYPWTHRGNPPLSGVKYIMTGWIEYQ